MESPMQSNEGRSKTTTMWATCDSYARDPKVSHAYTVEWLEGAATDNSKWPPSVQLPRPVGLQLW